MRVLRGCGQLYLVGFLWQLLAFVVVPAVHLGRHRADHYHDANGGIHAIAGASVSEHAGAVGDHGAVDRTQTHLSAPAVPHGAGGALHFGQLLTAPRCTVIAAPAQPLAMIEPSALVSRAPVRAIDARCQPRGPPLV